MYKFRSRDRRLLEQTARDVALTLQRDYFAFSGKKTTELSNRVPFYQGYSTGPPNAYPNILWTAGSQVDSAFNVLAVLVSDLSLGTYQVPKTLGGKNPGIWPVASINWNWIQAVYAFFNPAYAAWLVANNVPLPPGTSSWSTAWLSAP